MIRSLSIFLLISIFVISPASAQKAAITQGTYEIDSARSDIYVLIYRAGALGNLGHNHVISIRRPKGKITVPANPGGSTFSINVPVNSLEVDNVRLRKSAGKGFAKQPSASDISGTRKNMLSTKLLNGKKFSTIAISGKGGPASGQGKGTINLTIKIVGRTKKLSVPVTLNVKGDVLTATGGRRISHGDLGLKPFSALFGTLKVADRMDVRFRLRAKRAK